MQVYTLEDAEAELNAALAGGDPEHIRTAEHRVDGLDEAPSTVPLVAAALWYAEQGLRVFPCRVGGKAPATAHGCKDATTDADQIRAWWAKEPEANVAIATGHLVDVVDIDGYQGQESRARLWGEVFGDFDAESVGKVLTPRPGGMHIYVAASGDGNAANMADGIDYRGAGGYVVAPPSHTDVGTYRWLGPLDATALGEPA